MRAARFLLIGVVLFVSLWSLASAPAQAGQGGVVQIAVWADGNPTDGGNGIVDFINSLGGYAATTVTTAQLATPGFLQDGGYSAVYITRFGSSFGSSLGPVAAANVADYVGSDGAVVLFVNDWDDNLPTSISGDPADPLTSELIANSIGLAAGSGHGYIGEFNGGAMGLTANSDGLSPLGFFSGTAGPLGPFACQAVTITDAGGVIQGDVPSVFMPVDASCFRTAVVGVDPSFVFATYADGFPAIIGSTGALRPAFTPKKAPSTATKK